MKNILLLLFAALSSFALHAQCDIEVSVSSAGWGDQTTWTLTDAAGAIVLTGGTYGNGYSDIQVHTAVNPPYSFQIDVGANTFCDQDPIYSVTVGGAVDISGSSLGIDCGGTTGSIAIGACPSCAPPLSVAASNISTDAATLSWLGNAVDYFWEIQPSGVAQGTPGAIASGTALVDTFLLTGAILSPASSYSFYTSSNCGGVQSSYASVDFTTSPACGSSIGGLCYSLLNQQEVLLSFTSTPGTWAELIFNAGGVETCCDEVLVYDGPNGTGNIIYGSLTGGGLADYSGEGPVVSTTGTISLVVNSDVSAACGSNGYTPFDVTVNCLPIPTCFTPTALTTANTTDISADVNWIENLTASQWEVQYDTAGFTLGTGNSIYPTDTFATIVGLSPLTAYDFYVRAICAPGDTSDWSGVSAFDTEIAALSCPPGSGAPFTIFSTSFEDNPGCTSAFASVDWAGYLGFTNTNLAIGTFNGNNWRIDCGAASASGWIDAGPFDGTAYAYLETSGTTTTADTLTTIDFDISDFSGSGRATGYFLNGGSSTFTVERSLDAGLTWTNILTDLGQGGTANPDPGVWTLFEDDFSAVFQLGIANTITWRFIGSGGDNTGDIGLDLFNIEVCASCVPPSNVLAVATSADSALVTFNPYSGAAITMIEYGPAPLIPGTGTLDFLTNDTLVIGGLLPATTYDVLIASDCIGTTGDSSSVESYSFTTLCATYTAPYFQNFDAALSAPICWDNSFGTEPWSFLASGGFGPDYGVAGSVDHTSGSGNFAWIDASGNIGTNELITADIDISLLSFPLVGFWILSNNDDNTAQNAIELSYWDGAAWALLTSYAGNNANWVEISDTLPPTAPTTTRFRLVQTNTLVGSAFYNDLLVDDFFVIEAPTCPGVSNFSIDSVSTDAAVLSWTENGSATNWFVELVPTGTAPGLGTLVSNNTDTVTGLSSNTSYDFYVRSYCGPADSSILFLGGSFTTLPECGDTVGNLIYSLTNTAEVLVSFQGPPGDYVSLEFLAGQVETCCDEVLVYDGLNGTGNILYGALTGGGLFDYSGEGIIESKTGSISLVVNSDFSGTAASGGYTPFQVVLSCFPPPPFEIGVTSILSPVSSCGEAATPIQIVVENFGTSDIFYAPVVVELAGDINNVYSLVIDSLPSGTIDTIELSVLNTLAGGTVTFTAFTNLASDQDTSNDTTALTIEFGAVPAAPAVADVMVCDGDSAILGFNSTGALSWFETDTSSSAFFVGDTFTLAGVDTAFYVSQQAGLNGMATLDLFDSFGDGWNGHSLAVSINGAPVVGSPFTIGAGNSAQYMFPLNNGDDLTLTMNTGGFATEVSYTLTGPNGATIFEDGFASTITLGVVFDEEVVLLGCPSDLTMVSVMVSPTYLDTVVMSACDSMTIAGATVTTSGVYTDSLFSSSGCDSVVVYNLTINSSYLASESVTICDGSSHTLPDGTVVTAGGSYTTVLLASNACDSVIKTEVLISPVYDVSQNVQLCSGDTLTVGASQYTASGTYIDTLSTANGCDSLVTSNVVVFSSSDVSIAGVTVVCSVAPAVDLTLDPLGGTLSGPGVTGTSFDPAAAGVGTSTLVYSFADANGCDASASLDVEVVVCTGIEDIEGIETISIFPNPYVSTINVLFEDAVAAELNIKLFDITGKVILVKTVNTSLGLNKIALDVSSEIAAGVTMLQIERDGAVFSTTLLKK